MSEEKQIMDFFGRNLTDGEIRGTNLGKVLTYLKTTKSEEWEKTVFKLSILLGMSSRLVRENYLKGLGYWEIIKLYQNGNNIYWKWDGIKALNGINLPINTIPPPPEKTKNETNLDKEELGHKKMMAKKTPDNKNRCKLPSCNKIIPKSMAYCNEEHLKEHINIKRSVIS